MGLTTQTEEYKRWRVQIGGYFFDDEDAIEDGLAGLTRGGVLIVASFDKEVQAHAFTHQLRDTFAQVLAPNQVKTLTIDYYDALTDEEDNEEDDEINAHLIAEGRGDC